MTAAEYIEENSDYMEQVEDVAKITDQAFAVILDAGHEPGMDSEIEFTAETLAQVLESRENWSEQGSIDEQGEGFVVISDCQVKKGQRRCELVIVENGENVVISKQ